MLRMNKSVFTISFFILFFLTIAVHAHTGSVKGVVYSADRKRPLEGAAIFIRKLNTSAVTDAFGKFFIKGVEPGRYTIAIAHIGFEIKEEELTVEDGVTTDVSCILVEAPVKMEAVSINAKKELSPGSITGLDLKMRPVNTTQDLLRLVPGLFIAQHQGGGKAEQIFIRGFDCDHGTDLNVSVDGMPINMVSHAHGQGFADTHFIIPESVQEIDYGKGPYQADKGNMATAGYVAFKTRNELDNSFVKVEGGSYDYLRTATGINLLNRSQNQNSHQDAFIMSEYAYNRSYFDRPQNYNRFNLMGKYTNYISDNKILTLTLSGFNSFWHASGQVPERAVASGIVDQFGTLDPESGNTSRYNMNVQYYQRINANSYFRSNIYATYYKFKLYSDFTYYLIDSVNGDQIRQAESRLLTGYNGDYVTNFTVAGLKMSTQLGLGTRYDYVMNDELSHTLGAQIALNPVQLGDIRETNVYGYFNHKVFLTPQLVLALGGRYDEVVQTYLNKLQGDSKAAEFVTGRFSPKAGIYYNFGNKARLYYNYGTGFHTNDTRTLALGMQLGSPTLVNNTIPKSFSHDLGLVIKPFSSLLVSAAIWRLGMQQEFAYVGDQAILDTSGRTRRYGSDVSARYELNRWVYFDADINYANPQAIDKPAGQNYIPLAPILTSIGGVTFKASKHLTTGLRYRFMADRPANDDYTLVARGYTVWDVVMNYMRKNYELGIQVQNLLNVNWREAQFATETRLRTRNGMLEPTSVTDVCYTPGTPLFIKLSAAWKF